jgi:hypothetical protein
MLAQAVQEQLIRAVVEAEVVHQAPVVLEEVV